MKNNLSEDIYLVLSNFPKLSWDNHSKMLCGTIEINHTYLDEHIISSFEVELTVPNNYKEDLPRVVCKDKRVPLRFNHVYKNGVLCLATDADQLCFFADENNLYDWMQEYVIPYFFAVEYFKKYSTYPFGERKHGSKGILSFYMEKFDVDTYDKAFDMLKFIVMNSYRGHLACPCGSGRRIRQCHKNSIIYWKHEKYRRIFIEDYNKLSKERKVNE